LQSLNQKKNSRRRSKQIWFVLRRHYKNIIQEGKKYLRWFITAWNFTIIHTFTVEKKSDESVSMLCFFSYFNCKRVIVGSKNIFKTQNRRSLSWLSADLFETGYLRHETSIRFWPGDEDFSPNNNKNVIKTKLITFYECIKHITVF
jgi:hypothetical protein